MLVILQREQIIGAVVFRAVHIVVSLHVLVVRAHGKLNVRALRKIS